MSEIQVIGIGSPFGDDQLGWEVVEWLRVQDKLRKYIPQRLTLMILDRPGVRLLEYLDESATVILIDAIKSNRPIGNIYCLKFSRKFAEYSESNKNSTHGFGLLETLQLARSLGKIPKQLMIYGVEIETMKPNISRPIQRSIQIVSNRIQRKILNILMRQR